MRTESNHSEEAMKKEKSVEEMTFSEMEESFEAFWAEGNREGTDFTFCKNLREAAKLWAAEKVRANMRILEDVWKVIYKCESCKILGSLNRIGKQCYSHAYVIRELEAEIELWIREFELTEEELKI